MGRYYYAGGRRVELETDERHVAIDQKVAEQAGLASAVKAAAAGEPRLPGGVVLAPRDALGAQSLASLKKAGALRPVFRRDRAVVIVMPEIRVEFENARQRRAVKDALGKAPHEVEIDEDGEDRMVLRPVSGSGDDALAVANYVFEHAHPAAASVRFIQVVPRPTTQR